MSTDLDDFRASYAVALDHYLRNDHRSALHRAHELGRRAVEQQLTVSQLAAAYHEPLLLAILAAPHGTAAEQVAHAASRFYLETLSALDTELADSREIARAERRKATLLRQLSKFLADPSLALSNLDSVKEALRLVVEQAREILGADCAQATVQLGDDLPITAASLSGGDRPWSGYLSDELRPPGPESRPSGDWISAPITALDGHQFGSLEAIEKVEGDFTDLDQSVLIHIAEMASAAIERVQHYHKRA